MTAVTVLDVHGRVTEDTELQPVPWRRMAWVTWRQHRTALGGAAGLLGALAVYMWITGLGLHHAYGAAFACHPPGSPACSEVVDNFNRAGNLLENGYVLQVLPALIGAFVGAPVLARELETGTFRYAWTQGFGRCRWTLAKLVALGVAVTAGAAAISVLFSWYYQPYLAAGNGPRSLNEWPSLFPGLFGLRGVAFAAWTLAAFAIGCLAGMLLRRVVPAIVATLVAYAGLASVVGDLVRQRYLPALVTTKLNISGSAWVLSQQWRTRGGRLVSQSVLNHVLSQGGAQLAGKGGVPHSLGSWQYLVQHGYTQWTTYQPAGRFWPFQWIEGGSLLALSVLLIAATIWLVRRRAV